MKIDKNTRPSAKMRQLRLLNAVGNRQFTIVGRSAFAARAKMLRKEQIKWRPSCA
ncbi:hypothetical protein [Vannielia sp.]|uniref:hypothetical protein n=1 Tax=Vannielia sp. TaxID=2813045 RepID=UPI002639F271|nr:hypothetical protein [Vannielia sp.]MDF1871119.1 hypothetical protein [Vannielia sp.]